MARTNARDTLLAECEPYFLDGVHTIAQIAQRTQSIVRQAVERYWDKLAEAFRLPVDQIALVDYSEPDKLQKAKPTDGIYLGVKAKFSNVFEAAVYRYWEVAEKASGVGVFTWVKGRTKLDQLGTEIDDVPDEPAGPADSWTFDTWDNGTYYFHRKLGEVEIGDFDVRLDELITYYIGVMTKVGGVKKFLPEDIHTAARIGE